ncbi:Phospholipid hydroperoxide glutathione peroxidase, mitochondrial, partial [Stegodyphus mimosarum]
MRCRTLLYSVVLIFLSVYGYMFLRRIFAWNFQSKVVPFSATMATASGNVDWKTAKSVYDFSAKDIDGNEVSLEKYRGHVCLIVNVASK